MKRIKTILILIISLISIKIIAQKNVADSLLLILKSAQQDTSAVKTMNDLSWYYLRNGDYDNSLKHVIEAKELAAKLNFKKGLAKSNSIIGNVYYYKGDYDKALEYYLTSLKLREEIGDKLGISASLNNIGNVYDTREDYKRSLEIHLRSLKIKEELGDEKGAAYSYSNIGIVYYRTLKFDKALEYAIKGLEIQKKLGDNNACGNSYGNIGNIYMSKKEYDKALDYYYKALDCRTKASDKAGISASHIVIGIILLKKHNLSEGKKELLLALNLAREIAAKPLIAESYHGLSVCDSMSGNFKEAYFYHINYKHIQDSIYTSEGAEKAAKAEALYESEKKGKEIKLLNKDKEAQVAISAAETKKQNTIIISVVCGLLLVLIFSIFIFNRFKVTQKQKHIIEAQKEIVEEKQKEIIDSINYAKRIQYTLLAHDNFLKANLSNHFVYFNPKDIVSGDFYWATSIKTKLAEDSRQAAGKLSTENRQLFYLAVCDSTGHGVPGAFMSLLNIGFLTEAINEKGIVKPNEVFNFVRQRLINSISKEGQKDGFDGILMCFEEGSNKITYSAANNAPILIQNGNIVQLESDRMPVGIGERKEDFKLYSIDTNPNDTLYLYTDGYADQFGGIKGKKFKYKTLNELLLTINNKTPEDQKTILKSTFDSWKGNLEQVDDVLLVGIHI